MKLFVCNRSKDIEIAKQAITELLAKSEYSIAVQQEVEHSENWQKKVEQKMQESDFVIFLLGADTFESEQIIWEYAKAKDLNKQIVGYKLNNASEQSILFCQGFQVFESPEYFIKFLTKTYDDDRKLKLEQYKIMVSSTEKVTENRMKVNNLFFTITSSILSVGFVLGKTFGFSIKAILGMITLTILSLVVSYFWEKLILSYALLNRGKFKVIDKIEKQLRTNMFEDEWKILTQEIKYEPNSKTETTIIEYFRKFIFVVVAFELFYFGYLVYQTLPKCGC
ncbi:RipA family octameric membrane protein [Flavobacterium sp.]|uniref:RipA family octameric membrane protein n=1 Tax=Flavobacterium sp. TaxID=239 RepID=UPI003BDCC6FF